MGIGREVADAYIEVHGDLKPFRRDLDKANADVEKAAMENADTFTDAWGKRMESQLNSRWGSIVDAVFNDNPIDWSKAIGKFDSTNLDEARTDMTDFLSDMVDANKITEKQFNEVYDAIDRNVDKLKDHTEALKENDLWARRRSDTMEQAIAENKRWARTFEGMRKNADIANMETDFKRLALAMDDADLDKFAKGFDSFTKMRQRVVDVTQAMVQQGRLSHENQLQMIDDVHRYIKASEELQATTARTTAEVEQAKLALERYKRSLDGLIESSHDNRLEKNFRDLAAAIDSGDWSKIAKGHKDMDALRDSTHETMLELLRMGRISDNEFLKLGKALNGVTRDADAFNVTFADTTKQLRNVDSSSSGNGLRRLGTVMSRLTNITRGFREHLGGFAGLNVFGDMLRGGLDFIHNLDRIAVSLSKTTLLMGTMASVGASALAGLVTVAADLGDIIGGLGVLAPAYFTGIGIGIAVLVSAFKDASTVLADLTPAFAELQDTISAKFWEQLADPVRTLTNNLLPTLREQLGNTASSMGTVFAKMADAIDHVPVEDITEMFGRMNRAIDITGDAMPPLIRAFTNLGKAGSKTFERFGTWIVKISDQFDRFIQTASDNGDLDRWIEKAIDGMKDLGRSVSGAFGIFKALDKAARAAGFGGLKTFADALEGAAKMMDQVAFQRTLTTYLDGARDLSLKLGKALRGLGPAAESFSTIANFALNKIGDTVARLIGYVGQIFSNPVFQQGVKNFTAGLDEAVRALAPAIKPFGDSLGQALSLLGQIIVSVSEVASAFIVKLSPVFDSMSAKLSTLVTPLREGVIKAIEDLKPVLEGIDKNVMQPLVSGIKDSLLPALTGPGGLTEKLGKTGEALSHNLGDLIKPLVGEGGVLTGLVSVVGELVGPLGRVVDFFTPTLVTTIAGVGTALHNLANDIKVLKSELPITELSLFKNFRPEEIQKQIEEDSVKPQRWSEIIGVMFTKDIAKGIGLAWTEKIYPALADSVAWIWEHVVDGWNKLWAGKTISDESGANLSDFFGDFGRNNQGVSEDLRRNLDNFLGDTQRNFEGWSKDMEHMLLNAADGWKGMWEDIFKPLKDGWDNAFKGLDGWWKDVKRGFQTWMKDTFNIGAIFKDDAKITGSGMGGGAGGKGTGVSGAIVLPSMLDAAAEQSWLETFGETVRLGVETFFTNIGTNIAAFGETVRVNWDTFWGGLGTKVTEVWDSMTLWIQTKAAEIGTNILTFVTDVQTNWNLFWDSVGLKVNEVWTGIGSWITTKTAEIKAGIDGFIGDTRVNWDSFWSWTNQKATEIWNSITSLVTSKAAEIRTNINSFVTDVRNNWNTFWDGVRTKVSDAWNNITGTVSGKAAEIRGNISGFIGTVRGQWDSFWSSLGSRVSQAWNEMTSGVQTGINNVITYVQGMPGRILGALGNTGGLLSAAGSAIMGSLRSGLEGAWGGVQDFVGSIADWIAAHKGPLSYDRVLLRPAGKAIMDGLRLSMAGELGNLKATLEDITNAMVAKVTEAFAHSAMYVAGVNAALGLAQGLSDKSSVVAAAFDGLLPPTGSGVTVSGTAMGVGGATPAKTVNVTFEAGAVPITTPTKDPAIVASKTIDGIVEAFSNV